MFDGDKFWNLSGIWEKSISLRNIMMKIALNFTMIVAFFISTLTSPIIGSVIFYREKITYDRVDGINTCSLWGPENTEGSQCRFQMKLSLIFALTTMVICLMHSAGLVFFCLTENKKSMEYFAITVLRWNRNLILVLIGPQIYVSYIIQNLCFRLCSACNCYHLVITYSNFNIELGDSFKVVRKSKGCMTILTFLNCLIICF